MRKATSVRAFSIDESIRSSASGGSDPWDAASYLNIWVAPLTRGLVGYASPPGIRKELDGIVIAFNAFGTNGSAYAPYNKGRTTTHEIGHWLGLRHIWGDADCGNDYIDDTPPQSSSTNGCPSGVISTCDNGPNGNMYMNFMDFTDDACISMFTRGQSAVMRSLFEEGSARHVNAAIKRTGNAFTSCFTGRASACACIIAVVSKSCPGICTARFGSAAGWTTSDHPELCRATGDANYCEPGKDYIGWIEKWNVFSDCWEIESAETLLRTRDIKTAAVETNRRGRIFLWLLIAGFGCDNTIGLLRLCFERPLIFISLAAITPACATFTRKSFFYFFLLPIFIIGLFAFID